MTAKKTSAASESQPKADQPMAGAKTRGGKTKKTINFLLLSILLGTGFFKAAFAFAATQAQPTQMKYTLLESFPGFYAAKQSMNDLPGLILALYKFGIWTVGIAGLFMMVIGGIMYMTSAGNNSAASSAKEVITDSLLGIVAALGAYLFLFIINPDLTKIDLSNFVAVKVEEIGPGPSASGSGNCNAITDPSNPCNVEKLKWFAVNKGYTDVQAGIWAQQASGVCNAESGGKNNAESGGKCNGTSIAWGLFQINLNAWCDGAFTSTWNRSAGFTNGGCSVSNQAIFNACLAKAVDPTWNINKMWTLYQKSGWKPWEVTLNGTCKF